MPPVDIGSNWIVCSVSYINFKYRVGKIRGASPVHNDIADAFIRFASWLKLCFGIDYLRQPVQQLGIVIEFIIVCPGMTASLSVESSSRAAETLTSMPKSRSIVSPGR